MINYIEKIIEPNRLILAWQPLEKRDPTRTRRAIGEILRYDDGMVSFNYLVESNDYKKALEVGLEQYFPFTDRILYTKTVVETFSKRLPSRKRKDFKKFLESIRIKPDVVISDLALLGYSGATLPSDSFSIVNTFDGIGYCQLLAEVAGVRYYSKMFLHIGLGNTVELIPEPSNEFDSQAIRVEINGGKIGYINRLMTPIFHDWLRHRTVTACIEKIEGSIERPRVFLFVSVS